MSISELEGYHIFRIIKFLVKKPTGNHCYKERVYVMRMVIINIKIVVLMIIDMKKDKSDIFEF